ncbi:MAG: replication factor C large subunit [Candidatus Thermoplasmatota archaeon]|nr:replication factor C large subunit [Candidatus Thermoplasmatota archaeon]
MIDWTEKYRPKTLNQMVGNHSQMKKIYAWATAWNQGTPQHKAVVLSGKPGIGKTSAAYVLATDYAWLPIELNASDSRNATTINAVATAGATNQTFSDDGTFISTKQGGRKLIIIDEADNLFERATESKINGKDFGDKDGKRTIVKTVQVTSQPVILIVNDDYQLFKGSGNVLRKLCLHVKMYPAKSTEIVSLLRQICVDEQIHVDTKVLYSISETCEGDIRSAVRDLQSICMNKSKVTPDDVEVLGHRDHSQLIFDVLRDIFRTKDALVIKKKVRLVQEDPRMMILWIAENLIQSYSSIEDKERGYEMLSRADRYLGRTFRRNQYGLWSYASDLSSIGVAVSKQDAVRHIQYKFPSWLKQNAKEKNLVSAQTILIEKLSKYHHCSSKKARSSVLPMLKQMVISDELLLLSLCRKLNLTEEEMTFLAGSKGKKIFLTNQKENSQDAVDKTKASNRSSGSKKKKENNSSDVTQQSLGIVF